MTTTMTEDCLFFLEKAETLDPSSLPFVQWMRGDRTTQRPKLPDYIINDIWEGNGWDEEGVQNLIQSTLGILLSKEEEKELDEAIEESWRAGRDLKDEQETAEASWRWAVGI